MRNIYIASCTPDGGVLYCTLTDTGELIPREFAALDRPMYMAIEKGLLFVLLRAPFSGSDNSGLVRIALDARGRMGEPAPPESCMGIVSAHFSLMNGRIYTANYISGDISLLPEMNISHGEGAHPHYIAPTPDGRFVAVADLGTDSIYTYSPELELLNKLSLPEGSGCRHLSFSPDGCHAYCVNEKSSTLSILHYESGKFTLLDTVPALPEDWDAFSAAAAIRCDDEHVWASHRGFDRISCFARHGNKLILSSHIPCGGRWPRDFILADGYIICANEKSDTVTVLCDDKVVCSLPVKCPVAVISD